MLTETQRKARLKRKNRQRRRLLQNAADLVGHSVAGLSYPKRFMIMKKFDDDFIWSHQKFFLMMMDHEPDPDRFRTGRALKYMNF